MIHDGSSANSIFLLIYSGPKKQRIRGFFTQITLNLNYLIVPLNFDKIWTKGSRVIDTLDFTQTRNI